MIYFDISETEQFVEGVRAVLMKHGGYLVTPDYSSGAFFFAVVISMYGQERRMQLIMETKGALEKTSDARLGDTKTHKSRLNGADNSAAIEFFEKHGLKVEKVPFYDPKNKLISMDGLDAETAEKVKYALSNVDVFVMTLDENYNVENADIASENAGKSSMWLEGEVLKVNLFGRVDSINAPELISEFTRISEENTIKSVEADMKDLKYISSAGLRFIMIMKKHIKNNTIYVKNANKVVMDIFETTGCVDIPEFL